MPEAYQRLLLDVINGDASLFARSDEVELAWGIIDLIQHVWESSSRLPGILRRRRLGAGGFEPVDGRPGPRVVRPLPRFALNHFISGRLHAPHWSDRVGRARRAGRAERLQRLADARISRRMGRRLHDLRGPARQVRPRRQQAARGGISASTTTTGPPGAQLMGSDPAQFASAARGFAEFGFDAIDNFGCPVKKVLAAAAAATSSASRPPPGNRRPSPARPCRRRSP